MSSKETERSQTRYVYEGFFGTLTAQESISREDPSKETQAYINEIIGVRKNKNSKPDGLLSRDNNPV